MKTNKTKDIRVRLTAKEKRAVVAKADSLDMSVAVYIRMLIKLDIDFKVLKTNNGK